MDNQAQRLKIAPRPSSPFPRVVDTLFQGVDSNVFVIGHDLRPIWSSAPDGHLLGVPTSEWGSGTLIGIVHPDDREWMQKKRHEILSNPGSTVRGRIRICPPDGGQMTVLFTATNRFDDPAVNGLVITAREIDRLPPDDSMANSKQQASMLTQLMDGVRSSIDAIASSAAVLSDLDDPEKRSHVASITSASSALESLLGDVTDLAMISTGAIELASTVFSPAQVINDTTTAFGPMCTAKGIDLRLSIDAGLPSAVRGDPDRLSRVLRQLLTNAVQSTTVGHVQFEVSVNEAGRISFKISDTGEGTPGPSEAGLFGSIDTDQPTRSSGGFGLAIARQIIELMDGSLGYETTADGTAFWFDVMFGHARRVEDQTAALAGRADPASHATRQLHVLVVDDSDVNRLLATSQLERLNHTFDTASSGSEALVKLAADEFDVVLMDWHMPGMDGLEATRRWRSEHDRMHRLPIVSMTASAMAGDRERCLDAGASDYLAKPVSISDLDAMLTRWTRHRHTDAESAEAADPGRSKVQELIADLGNVGVVRSIVDAFSELVPQHRATAEAAFANGDHTTVHRSAHTLKSSAAMLGIDDLAAACLQLESAIAEGFEDIEIEVEAFVRSCNQAEPELRQLAADLADSDSSRS